MPSEARKITFDTAAIFTAKLISLLLGVVRLKYIAVYLGVGNFGIYTFAMYFVATFGLLFDVGVSQIITRDIAADRSRTQAYVFNGLALKLLLFVGTAILIVFATILSRFDGITNWAIAFSVFITGINSLTLVFTSVFQAYRKMRLVSIITVATDLSTSIAVIVLLIYGYGLFGLLVGSAIASFLVFVVTIFLYQKICGPIRPKLTRRLSSYLLNEGWPLALGGVGIVLYLNVTSSLLKYIQGDQAVGYYNAALKIIMILNVVPTSFTPVVYPFFSEIFNNSKEKLKSVLEVSVRYMIIVSVPLSVGTILVAKKLILTIYTPAFLPAVLPLQILIISSLFSYANYVFYTFFPAVKHQRFGTYITLPTGIAVVIANYLLIPSFGILVPSISLAAVEVILFIAAYLYLRHMKMTLNIYRMFAKPILSCLPMGLAVFLLSRFSVFVQVGAAIVTYGVAFYIFKGIFEEDRVILERILPAPIKELILRNI
jgi:O-antigen/teichoic acid export membrane protein